MIDLIRLIFLIIWSIKFQKFVKNAHYKAHPKAPNFSFLFFLSVQLSIPKDIQLPFTEDFCWL